MTIDLLYPFSPFGGTVDVFVAAFALPIAVVIAVVLAARVRSPEGFPPRPLPRAASGRERWWPGDEHQNL